MRDIEYILDFVVSLGKIQIMSGASLERFNDMAGRICHSYGLHAVSIFSLNTHLAVSAKDAEGNFAYRQTSVPSFGIHLERLRSLNQLSLTVCRELPDPKTLRARLREAERVREYPPFAPVLGHALAALSLSFIFDDSPRDAVSSALVIVVLYFLLLALARTGLNRIITNTCSAFAIGALSIFLERLGLAEHALNVIIANTLIIIPGVPMVNAARNLLCGNEMNGILQMFKVFLESATLAFGLVLSMTCFGGNVIW